MAQRGGENVKRMRKLARRFGLAGRGVPIACIVFVVLCGAIGLAHLPSASGLSVERNDADAQESDVVSAQQDGALEEEREEDQRVDESEGDALQTLYVHVDGAVASPGVFCVQGVAPRVNDAVQLAGGLLEDADTTSLNLAAPLADGQKVHVPAYGEDLSNAPSVAATDGAPSGGQAATADTTSVNINTANEEELQKLPGVGEATASAIVRDREQNGGFSSPEDIMRVPGIGEKKFEKMREMVCV